MRTRQDVIDACLELGEVYEDYPFHDDNWTVMRHRGSRKMFAAIHLRQGNIWVNVKAEPQWGEFWRNTFAAVVPAYHMNKEHWVSMILDGSMEQEDILRLLQDSYSLTKAKPRKRKIQECDR